mmetsp:Transcript_4540/g.9904  ORF Transcript_4540/g.9904 Transcript_4540/m.9904 type:complete len:222 (-) Transcript_4540:47-712(-)|eukprot:CAMPEP_0175993638 /NCGR_PEP_ID=MMETSP0108-20121206/54087_1 /TAXON_ID=195067 ORGANISM="Goniomonas pacifica, Strain CCMP1869" /NCGR_SAMPLE_ID=MMETSP0108 /ASSEMBLY_ACC=CAM_ASM_000204 /LENGTH=221 /DNA_ID=CAMNT_0017325471 /DNA_START=110 /DNA_END=775 /DNA_ORIENTATION=-
MEQQRKDDHSRRRFIIRKTGKSKKPAGGSAKAKTATKKPARPPLVTSPKAVKTVEMKPKKPKVAVPKSGTMKAQILALVAGETKALSLQAIKKALIAVGHTDSPRFVTQVNKTLKQLVDEKRSDFGKIGNSYHAGPGSDACRRAKGKAEADAEEARRLAAGELDCCWCGTWSDDHDWIDEDSIARGSSHECVNCGEIFWTWISDGYTRGHEVEYRKSKDYI